MNSVSDGALKSLNIWFGFIYVLIAGIGFGFLGIFGKLAFQNNLSVQELLTFRFLLAGVIIGTYLFIFKRNDLKLSSRQILISICLGVFGYATFSSLYFFSIQGLSVAIAAMLLFCFPFFVIIGEFIFFNEKISFLKAVSLVMCLLGIFLLIYTPPSGEMTSIHALIDPTKFKYIGLALAAALTYSVYVLASGQLQKQTPAGGSSFYVIFSAGLALLTFNFPQIQFEKILLPQNFLIILGIALICTIMPITCFLLGLQRLSSGTASIVVTIEPVVACVAGYFILDEHLSFLQILGSAIVIAAIIFIQRSHSPKARSDLVKKASN